MIDMMRLYFAVIDEPTKRIRTLFCGPQTGAPIPSDDPIWILTR